uniref:Putative secreted protein n=1 Tax=Anopheles darlingi TaxID=43151 RepID=A0A2M4DIK0_ANODA
MAKASELRVSKRFRALVSITGLTVKLAAAIANAAGCAPVVTVSCTVCQLALLACLRAEEQFALWCTHRAKGRAALLGVLDERNLRFPASHEKLAKVP